ncbi:MAG: hypothetical protein GX316_06590 [Firmicutes bacterium]|nr:hypothetical protein [Bacillota bacterium]
MSYLIPVVITALVVALIQVNLRASYPAYAVGVAAFFGVVVLFRILAPLRDITTVFYHLEQSWGGQSHYFSVLLRTMAAAYVTAFGAGLCKDAEENTLAVAVELTGKIVVMVIALPIVLAVVEALARLLP